MGIKGLFPFIKSCSVERDALISEHIPPGSILLIDGNGLGFHIYDCHIDAMPRQYGGSYDVFDRKLISHISRLTVEFGLTVRIYFDGNTPRMKEATALKRTTQRDDAWVNFREFCEY
eukprot:gene26427-47744_t